MPQEELEEESQSEEICASTDDIDLAQLSGNFDKIMVS